MTSWWVKVIRNRLSLDRGVKAFGRTSTNAYDEVCVRLLVCVCGCVRACAGVCVRVIVCMFVETDDYSLLSHHKMSSSTTINCTYFVYF